MIFKSIDIFCHIVDNFGDIGFVYRFAREFYGAYNNKVRVRVFVDDLESFQQINPVVKLEMTNQICNGIEYIYTPAVTYNMIENLDIADILIEAFACHIPEIILKEAENRPRIIINLEHLSAEKWVEGYHLKESLLPAPNLKKYFFMQGFTSHTGGVIIDPDLESYISCSNDIRCNILNDIIKETGYIINDIENTLTGTVFTYIRNFDALLNDCIKLKKRVILFVFGDKSKKGMLDSFEKAGIYRIKDNLYGIDDLQIIFIRFLPQQVYDRLLCCTDFNIVRGEDSFVRAILAGKPLIWNAYLQDDKYHKVKVEAFLNRFQQYCNDKEIYSIYSTLMLNFNDNSTESSESITDEQYFQFFQNLTGIEHSIKEMSYFLTRYCNLVNNIKNFLFNL